MFTIERGLEGLDALEQQWRHLAAAPGMRFYQFAEWYRAYLTALEPEPDSVYFCSFRRGERLVAVFPLKYRVTKRFGVTLRCLESPQHPHLNLADFVLSQEMDNADLLNRLVGQLASSGIDWDLLQIHRTPDDGAAAFCLANRPPARTVSWVSGESQFIPTIESFDAIAARLSGSFRRNLRRLRRRCEGLGKVRFRPCTSSAELQEAFPAFLELESSGWKGAAGQSTAIALHPHLRRFYEELMAGFGASGRCRINLLVLDDQPIAGQFCLVAGGIHAVLKIGYRESAAHVAPGNLLFEEVFRACSADGAISALTFVTSPDWARSWRPDSRSLLSCQIFNGTWRGLAGYAARRLRLAAAPLLERIRAARAAPTPDRQTKSSDPDNSSDEHSRD